MPGKLTRSDGLLKLRLSGLDDAAFSEALATVKNIPGHRWNPDDKVWEFEDAAGTATRIVNALHPQVDTEIQNWLRAAAEEVADELVTLLPEDATLELVWSSSLYDYQRSGVGFMVDHPHSILADDMGLGKTVQALAVIREAESRATPGTIAACVGPLAHLSDPVGRKLIICPNSVTGVWRREIDTWLGELAAESTVVIDAKDAAKRLKQLESGAEWVIVNWEKLQERVNLLPHLEKVDWTAVIADEAHRAKNRKSQQTKALWKLRAPIQLALTGTPIMGAPDDLWALLKWLRPEQYTSYWRFWNQYVESYQGAFKPVVTGVRNADQLRFELADKLVRRRKTKVLSLPEKVVETIPVQMKPKQQKLYNEAEKELFLEVERAVEEDEALGDKVRDALVTNDLKALTYLLPNGAARVTRLRQILETPACLEGEDVSGKLDAAVEIIADAQPKQFVLFTWFKPTAEAAASRLRKRKIKAEPLTGDTKAGDRADMVKRFQAGELEVLVCTIATGGVGLTLTAADTAIFVSRDWTPAINTQAEDRLWRIGQDNRVTILVLEAPDSVDTQRVNPANALKAGIAQTVFGAA
jgi:SNF2 family DNA or RNA helicase